MDNLTHTLISALVGDAIHRSTPASTALTENSRRNVAIAVMVVGGNLPDIDVTYTGWGASTLDYLLHHRGHTHTVVGALVLSLLLFVAVRLWWRYRKIEPHPADIRFLIALAVLAPLLHIALDFTNSYGVHPFWPVDDRWYYGDSVFIVEPWFWVASVPALVAASRTRVARVLLSLVLLAGLVLAWRVNLVSTGAAASLTAGAVVSVALAFVLRPNARVAAAIGGWVAVTLIMALGSAKARDAALQAARAWDPAADVLDVVVSPLPANAVCMAVIIVERAESGSSYRVATARVSSAPWITDASRCAARTDAGGTFRHTPRPSTPAVRWDWEWSAPIAELATLARQSCPALTALRFIRVPAWQSGSDMTVLLGDVRFGGGSGNSFSDVRVPRQSSACPRAVPPWTPPRAELLW